jgi:hypothetical protein
VVQNLIALPSRLPLTSSLTLLLKEKGINWIILSAVLVRAEWENQTMYFGAATSFKNHLIFNYSPLGDGRSPGRGELELYGRQPT